MTVSLIAGENVKIIFVWKKGEVCQDSFTRFLETSFGI